MLLLSRFTRGAGRACGLMGGNRHTDRGPLPRGDRLATPRTGTHFYSRDGKTWQFLSNAVQPYSHTVRYDDGTSHMFVTIERPCMFFDASGP